MKFQPAITRTLLEQAIYFREHCRSDSECFEWDQLVKMLDKMDHCEVEIYPIYTVDSIDDSFLQNMLKAMLYGQSQYDVVGAFAQYVQEPYNYIVPKHLKEPHDIVNHFLKFLSYLEN